MDRDTSSFPSDAGLSRFDDGFTQAAAPGADTQSAYQDIPDGFYDASVEDVQIGQAASTGNPMIVWRLRIRGPECEGRAITKVRIITDRTLGFVKQDLERLELHLDRLSDLPARAGEMIGREVRICKRTNPQRQWTDVYFVSSRKGPGSESRQQGGWSTGTDDDLPF